MRAIAAHALIANPAIPAIRPIHNRMLSIGAPYDANDAAPIHRRCLFFARRYYRDIIRTSMSDTFTRGSRRARMHGANAFQNKGLNAFCRSRHGSCIGTLRKSASCFRKGPSPHHGLDLVDRLVVPNRRIRRHAAGRIGRPRAKGEGARLVSFEENFHRTSGLRRHAASTPSVCMHAQRERLRVTRALARAG